MLIQIRDFFENEYPEMEPDEEYDIEFDDKLKEMLEDFN
jgi:hypothetical protein